MEEDDEWDWDYGTQELIACLEDKPSAEERQLLTRRFFPTKVGGRPAWLVPRCLPDPRDLACRQCGQGLRFLMQVYASRSSERESAFHRMLHVFLCTNCQPNGVRVFRAQLPRVNPFYSAERPNVKADKSATFADDDELGALTCGKCGLPHEHAPEHCHECARRARNGDGPASFQEREMTMEDAEDPEEEEEAADLRRPDHHDEPDEDMDETDAANYAKWADEQNAAGAASAAAAVPQSGDPEIDNKLREWKEKMKKEPEAKLDASEQKVFEEYVNKNNVRDDEFLRFLCYCRENPGHVVRYKWLGKPLWYTKVRKLVDEPPPCELCGGPRVFEFQIQSPLIALLGNTTLADRLDFGTLCIFTCRGSCDLDCDAPYAEEFVYVQAEPVAEWVPPPRDPQGG